MMNTSRLLSLCLLLLALSTLVSVEGKKAFRHGHSVEGTAEEKYESTGRKLDSKACKSAKKSKKAKKMKKSKKGKKECKKVDKRARRILNPVEGEDDDDYDYIDEFVEYDADVAYDVSCKDYDDEEEGPLGMCGDTCVEGQICCATEVAGAVFAEDEAIAYEFGCAFEAE